MSEEKTPRGFDIFKRIPTNLPEITLRVQESCLACEGAHVQLITDDKLEEKRNHRMTPRLSVDQAEILIEALQNFCKKAKDDLLTEPYIPDNEREE